MVTPLLPSLCSFLLWIIRQGLLLEASPMVLSGDSKSCPTQQVALEAWGLILVCAAVL